VTHVVPLHWAQFDGQAAHAAGAAENVYPATGYVQTEATPVPNELQ